MKEGDIVPYRFADMWKNVKIDKIIPNKKGYGDEVILLQKFSNDWINNGLTSSTSELEKMQKAFKNNDIDYNPRRNNLSLRYKLFEKMNEEQKLREAIRKELKELENSELNIKNDFDQIYNWAKEEIMDKEGDFDSFNKQWKALKQVIDQKGWDYKSDKGTDIAKGVGILLSNFGFGGLLLDSNDLLDKYLNLIKSELKELDLNTGSDHTLEEGDKIKQLIHEAIMDSSLYNDKNKQPVEDFIYQEITKEYDIVKKGLNEGPPAEDFLDKVEDNISGDIVDLLSETLLNLGDIQKKLLKFRPKLVDEVAKATGILEEVQGKLTGGEAIGEEKDENTAGYKKLNDKVKKELQSLIQQRNEVNDKLDKIVQDGGKIILSDPLYIKSRALTAKINKLNPKGLKVNLKEEIKSILKKKKATSAEFKKMKTMKGFKSSDWKWEPKEHLYIKK